MLKKNVVLILIGGLLFLAGALGFVTNYLKDASVCVAGIGIFGLVLIWIGIHNERYAKSRTDVHALISKLAHEDVAKRYDAAQALGVLKDARATEALIIALKDEDERVQQAAAEALSRIGDLNLEQTQILNEWFERFVGSLITAFHQQVSSRLMPNANPWEDPDHQKTCDALVAIGSPAVKHLIAALNHSNLNVRLLAISALGRIGDPSAIKPLTNVMHTPRTPEREWAVRALGNIGHSDVLEEMIPYLHDPNIEVREATVYALEKIGDPRALPELELVAQSDKALVDRFESIGSLANKAIKNIRKRTR